MQGFLCHANLIYCMPGIPELWSITISVRYVNMIESSEYASVSYYSTWPNILFTQSYALPHELHSSIVLITQYFFRIPNY